MVKKIGIMQPYFFPYIGYWQLINDVDTYVIYDDVNYIKGGWINRNRILMKDKDILITLRLNGSSPNKLINQIEVENNPVAKRKLLKSIQLCYSRAPYFDEVYSVIEDIINHDEAKLSEYLAYSIKRLCEYMSINTKIILSSELVKNPELKAQDKVIEICTALKGTEYINAIGGIELYDKNAFSDKGLELKFLKTCDIKYTQHTDEFTSNLSIIDVLMFNSKDEVGELLEKYELV